MVDATSFETEEIFLSTSEIPLYLEMCAPFFDPSGGTLYAERAGTLYKWDLHKNEHRAEWWIGE